MSSVVSLAVLLVSLFVLGSCNDSSVSTPSCPEGSETCACYGNGTCDDGLECRSDLCVELDDGDSSDDDDNGSDGDSSDDDDDNGSDGDSSDDDDDNGSDGDSSDDDDDNGSDGDSSDDDVDDDNGSDGDSSDDDDDNGSDGDSTDDDDDDDDDNGDGDSGDDDDDDTDGDHTDGDNDLPADHCVNAGCDEFFDCDEESGECVMGTDHCLNEPCLEHFVCNETTGACDPGPDHCNTTGCDTYYQCLEAIGECRPAADHCSNAGCDNHYDCNTESGECEKAQDHCDNTPCPSHFVCNHVSGDCDMDASHCANAGCALRHTCQQATGECVPGEDHCTTAGCTNNYVCYASDGRCYPSQASQSACSGSCDGNTDQYCIDGGDFLCDCDDTLSVLDCEVYCLDEGYPYLEGCSRYTPESGSAYYRCHCRNYPDTVGTCAQPVEIERFPFKHAWEIYNYSGMGAVNNLSPNGCTATGSIAADGLDRVYRMEAQSGERYRIQVTTEFGDPWVSIRASCGNADTNNWCVSASGTVVSEPREDMMVMIPETGDYYIAVEGNPGIMIISYTLTVTKL